MTVAEFADRVTLQVQAGHGGNGCASIHREKFKPLGGPDGGNGGRGGDVIFRVDPGTATLLDFHRRPLRSAGNGKPGAGSHRSGAEGTDLIVSVPDGTVVRGANGEVLARVGSAGYFEDQRAGQVDMTNAVRSPGSTLKPFIYGLGFEDGVVHPETLIEDRPVRYGSYAPENFDLTFQGTVSVRKALQMSLNVPAVAVLDKIGAGRFTARLRQAGGDLVLPKGEVPGLAMGLGGVGVRLSDLVRLYAGLARLGTNPIDVLKRSVPGYLTVTDPALRPAGATASDYFPEF